MKSNLLKYKKGQQHKWRKLYSSWPHPASHKASLITLLHHSVWKSSKSLIWQPVFFILLVILIFPRIFTPKITNLHLLVRVVKWDVFNLTSCWHGKNKDLKRLLHFLNSLGLYWHLWWWLVSSLYGSTCPQPCIEYWQAIGLEGQKVSWSSFLSAKRKSLHPDSRNLQGKAIILIILSNTTLGASTKVCLHVLQLVILLPLLHWRQRTWPLRHWSKFSPQNFPQRLQLKRAIRSSYLRSPSMLIRGLDWLLPNDGDDALVEVFEAVEDFVLDLNISFFFFPWASAQVLLRSHSLGKSPPESHFQFSISFQTVLGANIQMPLFQNVVRWDLFVVIFPTVF